MWQHLDEEEEMRGKEEKSRVAMEFLIKILKHWLEGVFNLENCFNCYLGFVVHGGRWRLFLVLLLAVLFVVQFMCA